MNNSHWTPPVPQCSQTHFKVRRCELHYYSLDDSASALNNVSASLVNRLFPLRGRCLFHQLFPKEFAAQSFISESESRIRLRCDLAWFCTMGGERLEGSNLERTAGDASPASDVVG